MTSNAPSTQTGVADVFSRALEAGGANTLGEMDARASGAAIGGFLVCLDVPEATEFGIDYEVFRTGPKFQGVKFVPPGIHFVVFRSKDHEHGIRHGFFVNVERHGQVIVREWSAEKEELSMPRPGLNIEHLENAVTSFQLDAGLGPYPKQHYGVWRRLSSFITESVLKRCGLDFGAIVIPGHVDDALLNTGSDGVVTFFIDQPRTVRFTQLRHRDVASMSVGERTAYHFDKSIMLTDVITHAFDGVWHELIGELQLAFVTFLQLSSLAALEHWKQILVMLCSCESALATHTALFVAFVKVLRTQLKQIPVDFFDDELSEGNFLRPCLLSLLEVLSDCDFSTDLLEQRRSLSKLLESRFRLTTTGDRAFEDDEFAPAIVPAEELEAPASDASNEEIAFAFLRSRNL